MVETQHGNGWEEGRAVTFLEMPNLEKKSSQFSSGG
jgi:hypothetical protein